MDLKQFLACLGPLGTAYASAKSRELMYKLQELKAVLLYPGKTATSVTLNKKIRDILDEKETKNKDDK